LIVVEGYVRWADIRDGLVARAGGEEAFERGKQELLAEVTGYRLAELRKKRRMTQQEIADRMGVTQAIVFDDGDIAGIA
jgi:DNA-binding transcriptional regulator LsrR (DeoR family)